MTLSPLLPLSFPHPTPPFSSILHVPESIYKKAKAWGSLGQEQKHWVPQTATHANFRGPQSLLTIAIILQMNKLEARNKKINE